MMAQSFLAPSKQCELAPFQLSHWILCLPANFVKLITVIIGISSSHISSVESGISPHVVICHCPTFVLDAIGHAALITLANVSLSLVELNVDPVSSNAILAVSHIEICFSL